MVGGGEAEEDEQLPLLVSSSSTNELSQQPLKRTGNLSSVHYFLSW